MDKFIFKKVKLADLVIIIALFLILVIGFLTFMKIRTTASKQVESTSKIAFQVFLRGVTITGRDNPIKSGENTFVSIRNVPYTALKILDVKADTKKIVMPNPDRGAKKPFILVEDYSQAFMYDMVVTVTDTAKITKDGAVVGGNKVKIGLPITLEGKDYKFNGTVSNIVLLDAQGRPILPKAAQTGVKTAQPVQGEAQNSQAPATK